MLSTELWLKVFGYLGNFSDLYAVSDVCISWRAACGMMYGVEVDMNAFYLKVTYREMYTIAKTVIARFKHVCKVDYKLMGGYVSIHTAVMEMFACNYNLRAIDASYGRLPAVVSTKCPLLTEVYLIWTELEDDDVEAVVQGCPRLEVMDLSFNTCSVGGLSDNALAHIGAGCGELRVLKATTNSNLADMTPIAKGCPKLMKVDMSWCPGIVSDGIIALAKQCTKLVSINLRGCRLVGDAALIALANCSLYDIDVGYCKTLTDNSINVLAKRCPELTIVGLRGLNITTLAPFAEHSKKLVQIDIAYCNRLSIIPDFGYKIKITPDESMP